MTVEELILELSKLPSDAKVYSAGNFGWEPVVSARYRREPATIADLPGHAVLIDSRRIAQAKKLEAAGFSPEEAFNQMTLSAIAIQAQEVSK